MATAAAEQVPKPQPATGPLIVDLGKKSRKNVKRLRDGKGKLMNEVQGVLSELRANGKLSSDAQPVLIIVRQRPRRRGPALFR
jgi:uncharacterized protein DUF6200